MRLTTLDRSAASVGTVAAATILRAQEKERARVARELHDDTGQALTLLLVRLQLLSDQVSDPRMRTELAELREIVQQTLDGVRRLAVDLGPTVLDELGLASAVEWLVDRVRTDGSLRVELRLDVDGEIARPVALAVFRVVQEALTNAVRHAKASCVSVRLETRGGVLRLVVADDGIGFDLDLAAALGEENVGLAGMSERIALVEGELRIDSKPGGGTRVIAQVPLRQVDR
jgi:two-component system, NarL family, sensor histidine kinase UhpB